MGLEKVSCLHLFLFFLSPRFVRSLMTHATVRHHRWCWRSTHKRPLNAAFNCQFNAKPKRATVCLFFYSGCWWPSVLSLYCSRSDPAVALSLWLDFRESPWRKQTRSNEHFHSHQNNNNKKQQPCQPLRTCPVSSFIFFFLVTLWLNQQEV